MPIIGGGSGGGSGSGAVTLITDTLLAVDTATFDFTGIAGTFKHLELYAQLRMTGAVGAGTALLRFNNDSGANYDYEYVFANDISAAAARQAAGTSASMGDSLGTTATANNSSTHEVTIPNYASTTFFKQALSKTGLFIVAGTPGNWVEVIASQWRSTAAITRITITPSSGNWLTGSRVSLYGIT